MMKSGRMNSNSSFLLSFFLPTFTLTFLVSIAFAQNAQGSFSCVKSNPCKAPAECEDIFFGYICHCPQGFKGDLCDQPLTASDNICLSKPCWNQGRCNSYNVSSQQTYNCSCPVGTFGPSCRVYRDFEDYYIRVLNKGWYTADVQLTYTRKLSYNQPQTVGKTILALQDAVFRIPSDAISFTTRLTVDAILGVRVMDVQLYAKSQCFDVWGTTLIPYWTPMPC